MSVIEQNYSIFNSVLWNKCLHGYCYLICIKIPRFKDKKNVSITFAENPHIYRTKRDLGQGMFVISGKNQVFEIFWLKPKKSAYGDLESVKN